MATWLANLLCLLALAFRWFHCSNRDEQARVRTNIRPPYSDDNTNRAHRDKSRQENAGGGLEDASSEGAISVEISANEKTNRES